MRLVEITGGLAAAALVVRAVLDWRSGTGWPLLVIAAALVAALVLRRRYPRR